MEKIYSNYKLSNLKSKDRKRVIKLLRQVNPTGFKVLEFNQEKELKIFDEELYKTLKAINKLFKISEIK